jgi:hypothetical protein
VRGRSLAAVVLSILLMSLLALPAAAGGPEPGPLTDTDGDGIPDIAEGQPGDVDDLAGALTLEEMIAGTDAAGIASGDDAGSSLEGPCGGWVASYDSDGNALDFAMDLGTGGGPVDATGNPAFEKSKPFLVDTGGDVLYGGFTEVVFLDHRWKITVQGIGLDSGGDDNPKEEDANAGEVNLGDTLPFTFSALLKVNGNIRDDFGSGPNICTGSGWVEFTGGSPIVPTLLAVLLFGGGFAGLLFNARPALTWKGDPLPPPGGP